MSWVKVDDRYAFHPKTVAAGLEATGMDVRAICHCSANETDGFIADGIVEAIGAGLRRPHDVARRLVTVGRWIRDDERGGYVIHDYLEYNESKAQANRRRAADRRRKGEGIQPDSGGIPDGFRTESEGTPTGFRQDASRTRAGGRAHALPRPVPSSSNSSLSTDSRGADSAPQASPEGSAEEDRPTASEGAEPGRPLTLVEACALVAERRLAKRDRGSVSNPRAWTRKAAANAESECRAIAGWEALSADELADAVEPVANGQPWPFGEQPPSPWDEQPDGSVARRSVS